jgi:hypothetical protein
MRILCCLLLAGAEPDLVDAEDLLRAIQGDASYDDLPRHNLRRLQLNFAFGASY